MKSKFLMLSPITLGWIGAGALFFIIFAVVRSATADTGKVEAITAQQYAAFQAAVAQSGNNASAALPTFVLATEAPEVYHPTVPAPIAQGVQPLIWYDATATETPMPLPTATATPAPTNTPWPTVPPPTPTPAPLPTIQSVPPIPCWHIQATVGGAISALDFSPHKQWFDALSEAEKQGVVEWCGGR